MPAPEAPSPPEPEPASPPQADLAASLERAVAAAVARLELTGRRVLVAASAGIDSTALVHALRALPPRSGLSLGLGHVNHGLRGAESRADEAFVRELGATLGLPVHVAAAPPEALREGRSSRDRPTLQEAARDLRYRRLRELAHDAGADRIATAHTADDQAETVLLRLLRGSGPDGLGGVPERSPDGVVARPLLAVSRAAIEAYARERRIAWREDASNASCAYARNRLRLRWLPGLAREFNPRLLRALGELAEAQRRDSEWIRTHVEREVASRLAILGTGRTRWLGIDAADWDSLPEALARRVAREALRRAGSARQVSRAHLERMGAFLREGRVGTAIELPGDLRLVRDAAGFRLGPLRGVPRPG